MAPAPVKTFWKESNVFQIWPASFCDSNGDGIGDIQGIISKLDYVKNLGTNMIWLSPIFASPDKDMGYDVSDYQDINTKYGTVADVEELIAGCHERKIKLILDFVMNHTSDQHAWFKESRSSRDNPKRDWYVWRDAVIDEKTGERRPPTNWQSCFNGSTWEWDELTEQCYLHIFVKEQPDLNYENEEVRQAMWSIVRWWLDKGVDGFRIDAVQFVSKPTNYDDAPIVNPDMFEQPSVEHLSHGPRLHEFIKEMTRDSFGRYPNTYNVGELAGSSDPDVILPYITPNEKGEYQEMQTVFTFEHVEIDCGDEDPMFSKPWPLTKFKGVISKWQNAMINAGAWNALYMENHDQCRSISRYTSDKPEFRAAAGKMLALHQASLCGTMFVYQGQELAAINMPSTWKFEDLQDVGSINWYNDHMARLRKKEGREDVDDSKILRAIQMRARDNARLPIPWTSGENAGFSTGKPWMRLNDDWKEWNAEVQEADPDSVLNFWRKMIKVRNENEVLVYGDFTELDPSNEEIYCYRRTLSASVAAASTGQTALVVLNFSKAKVSFDLEKHFGASLEKASLLVGSVEGVQKAVEGGKIELEAFEGRIYLV